MPYDLIVFSHPVSGGASSERRCGSVKTNSVIVVGLRTGAAAGGGGGPGLWTPSLQQDDTQDSRKTELRDFSFSVAGDMGLVVSVERR